MRRSSPGVIVMYEGMSQINPLFIRVARTLGATDWEIFAKVIVPLTVPHVLTAARVALGVAWATLVAAELVAAQNGIGAVIQNASAFFNLTTIYAGIITIGFLALMMDTRTPLHLAAFPRLAGEGDAMNEVKVRFQNVSKSFHAVEVVRNVSFDISEGDFVSLVGPRGAGRQR